MLLVNITLLDSEWPACRASLARSVGSFYRSFRDEVFFHFVLQTKSGAGIDVSELGVPATQVEVCSVTRLSVSAARNRGIDYGRRHGFESIVFHDASLLFLPAACAFFRDHHLSGVLRCGYAFAAPQEQEEPAAGDAYRCRATGVGRRHSTYVWTYCFPLRMIQATFDERFGPGESTRYNCGEDVLFLRENLAGNRAGTLLEMTGVGVLHPPRPADFSKHLAYAYGQGKVRRIVLGEDRDLFALLSVAGFFGNAVLRALLLRKNGFRILRSRLAGFLDRG
jgi:hypothetical protein